MPPKTIDSFFKKRSNEDTVHTTQQKDMIDTTQRRIDTTQEKNPKTSNLGSRPTKISKIQSIEFDASLLERDPGKRAQIWSYPTEQQDQIRRAYITTGPYQPIPPNTPDFIDKKGRRFLPSWYKNFPNWLEFSPTTNAAYCLPCFLYNKPSNRVGQNAFTIDGFRSWKKVNEGKYCPLLGHEAKNNPSSSHRKALEGCRDLMNSLQHIEKIIEKQTTEQVMKNRLQLKCSIDAIKFLTFQAISFRGNDESLDSENRGNFLELLQFLGSYNEQVSSVILKNAPKNACYISPSIQKEILSIFAQKIQHKVREDIGESKFCIIVDESQDESHKEQMAIVLRFVDNEGFIQERFFDIVHVLDTFSLTLKQQICDVLSRHNLSVQNIRGQGYDGASNMSGEFNGVQALIAKECPFAYYIHCFAHRLQLILVETSNAILPVAQFFIYLKLIIRLVTTSAKRSDQLTSSQVVELEKLVSSAEVETGKGKNQVRTLKRPGDTRWGSHYNALSSLIELFRPTCLVLEDIIVDGGSSTQRGEANGAFDVITSFEFILIMHFLKDIFEISNILCEVLQRKSQDIVNAMHLVSATKTRIQQLREDGWDSLFNKVKTFCEVHQVDIPDMASMIKSGNNRYRTKKNPITLEHHYRVDVFYAVIDVQLQEITNRFQKNVVELLMLSSALNPMDGFPMFKVEDICKLACTYYPVDFSEQEKLHLKLQLELFKIEVDQNEELRKLSTISELCQVLKKTRKSMVYPLVDRLIRLVLTLPVSTATTERAFSSMKLIKTPLRNKMGDEFLANSLITYIEKGIARSIDTDSIIDAFDSMKDRRAQFRMPTFDKI